MSKDIIKMNDINKAIRELGNKMLDNSCVQLEASYGTSNRDCYIKCNEMNDTLIKYIIEERMKAEEHIISSLSEQFDRPCYVLITTYNKTNITSLCFSKTDLKITIHNYNKDIKINSFHAYFVDVKYYPPKFENSNNEVYMDTHFKVFGNIIIYSKPEEVIEKPVINYCISNNDLGIRQELEIFLRRDFNKIYKDDYDCQYDFKDDFNGSERVVDLGHEKYNYYYKMPYIIKRHIELMIQDLRDMAKESKVILCDNECYDVENYTTEEKMKFSTLPESVINFWKLTNCNFEIINSLFKMAFGDKNYIDAPKNDIAWLRIKDFYDFDEGWHYNETIATCNTELLNKYIEKAIEGFLSIYDCDMEDCLDEENSNGQNITKEDMIEKYKTLVNADGNRRGEEYFNQYMGRDIEYME